jgi:hypothetical protein
MHRTQTSKLQEGEEKEKQTNSLAMELGVSN